jgi:hypothetical protein
VDIGDGSARFTQVSEGTLKAFIGWWPLPAVIAVQWIEDFVLPVSATSHAHPFARLNVLPPVPGVSWSPSGRQHSAMWSPHISTTTLKELMALGRVALLRPIEGSRIHGRGATIALLCVLLLAMWIGAEPLLRSRALAFWPYSLPHLAWIAVGTVALVFLLSRLSRPKLAFRRALLLTLGALPLAIVASLAAEKFVGAGLLALLAALGAYALLYFGFGLRMLTGRPQWPALMLGLAAASGFVWALEPLRVNPRLWIPADEDVSVLNGGGDEWTRMARVQFAQQARIDAYLARVAAHATPEPEVFFLGFAGYGGQQVFAREIELAAQVVGERFDVGQRSLLLVNEDRDVQKWPLASEAALAHVLRRLGELMDDEDVLFLALSSHGDRDSAIEVTRAGTVPTKLRASAIARMLRESGIKWRVLVVSACYSGTFVEPLADEGSIVITAAADDRKSFGCDDKRQLTYFGEAFYRDALNKAATLQAAFTAARRNLEQKEQRLGITPSLPQAHFGAQLHARLEKRVQRRNVNTTPSLSPQ